MKPATILATEKAAGNETASYSQTLRHGWQRPRMQDGLTWEIRNSILDILNLAQPELIRFVSDWNIRRAAARN